MKLKDLARWVSLYPTYGIKLSFNGSRRVFVCEIRSMLSPMAVATCESASLEEAINKAILRTQEHDKALDRACYLSTFED